MDDTILLVGHGSRDNDGNREIQQFAECWRQKLPNERIEVCFIEFADILLEEGLSRAAKNSERVLVLPLIINAAGHVKLEIPSFIARARLQFPHVQFIYGRHFGAETPLLEIVQMRLHSAMVGLDLPDPKSTSVVVVARGSSDMTANAEVAKMAHWLFATTDHEQVDYAFTGITYPRLETVVQRHVLCGAMDIIIVPLYLFTGRLIKRIGRQVTRLQKHYPNHSIAQAGYIGIDEKMLDVLTERLQEIRGHQTSILACDGCKYREIAAVHEEHHHH